MNIIKDLLQITSEEHILVNEPMKNHTTFKIGGNVSYLLLPQNSEEIVNFIKYLKEKNIPYYIIGNGSNLLVCDEGISGVVIKTANHFKSITVEGEVITAQSGALLSKISSVCMKNSLTGFEELSGIPGTIGGAVFMNAGAYGREFKDIVIDVTFIDENGTVQTLKNDHLDFGYRKSFFSDKDYFILSTRLKLIKGDLAEIKAKTAQITKKRKDKQPIEYPSAGSTFKRPPNYFAAKLIEDCGLKGCCVGGAKVSDKHSGFVINTGNATSEDVLELTKEIKEKVKDQFDVDLELEVKYLDHIKEKK